MPLPRSLMAALNLALAHASGAEIVAQSVWTIRPSLFFAGAHWRYEGLSDNVLACSGRGEGEHCDKCQRPHFALSWHPGRPWFNSSTPAASSASITDSIYNNPITSV